MNSGYGYDAFSRTTTLPGSTISYYTNDLAYQQTSDGKRQTWQLDAGLRFRSWKVETGSGTTWTQTASKINHYGNDSDSPRWIVEDTTSGALTRNVEDTSGDLAATTSKSGDTVLQLANIHGDVALQLPLDTSKAPTALDGDEYGNPRTEQEITRYNWLGAKQRSTETLTGLTLMGVRLYNPATGRFLTIDPVYGGSANAYEYGLADPQNNYDLDGRWVWAVRGGWIAVRYIARKPKIRTAWRKKSKPKQRNTWSQKNRKPHKKGKSKSSKDKHENADRHGGNKKRGHPNWKPWNSFWGGRWAWR